LRGLGHAAAAVIGRVVGKNANSESVVRVIHARLENFIGTKEIENVSDNKRTTKQVAAETPEASCCSDAAPAEDPAAAGDALAMFKDFMKAANEPGLIDRRNKKLMAVMLSIAVRCAPCLRIHLKAALAMGLTKAEIDEAAGWPCPSGGCSALMFYKEIARSW